MSVDLPYIVRVYWDNGRGFARQIGMSRQLDAAPVIEGLPRFTMLDYIPQVVALIQPWAEKVRDLESHETRSIQRWLDSLKGLW